MGSSQRCFVIAHEPPKANLVKLSGNFLITSVIEALGEAFALAGKAGIDMAQYLDLLTRHAIPSARVQDLWRTHCRGTPLAGWLQG
jgi:3-hydroxyisobutyrate dehydrogenase-like beta-hydroxyacid dehydrogenase